MSNCDMIHSRCTFGKCRYVTDKTPDEISAAKPDGSCHSKEAEALMEKIAFEFKERTGKRYRPHYGKKAKRKSAASLKVKR